MTGDNAIAAAAATIALAALSLALYEAHEQRRHNRLSLMPHLTLQQHLGATLSLPNLGLALTNDGPGPALIMRCVLRVGAEIGEDGGASWELAIEELGLKDLRHAGLSYSTITNGSLRPGDEVWLLYIPRNEGNFTTLRF